MLKYATAMNDAIGMIGVCDGMGKATAFKRKSHKIFKITN